MMRPLLIPVVVLALAAATGEAQRAAARPAAVANGPQAKPTDAASAAVNASLARRPKRKQPPSLTSGKPDAARDERAVVPAGRVAVPRRASAGAKATKR